MVFRKATDWFFFYFTVYIEMSTVDVALIYVFKLCMQ